MPEEQEGFRLQGVLWLRVEGSGLEHLQREEEKL